MGLKWGPDLMRDLRQVPGLQTERTFHTILKNDEKSWKYLQKVARITGAVDRGKSYELRVDTVCFYVDCWMIWRYAAINTATDTRAINRCSTCYTTPVEVSWTYASKVAAALLALRGRPEAFFRWEQEAYGAPGTPQLFDLIALVEGHLEGKEETL